MMRGSGMVLQTGTVHFTAKTQAKPHTFHLPPF
jgi:hypothetical protein